MCTFSIVFTHNIVQQFSLARIGLILTAIKLDVNVGINIRNEKRHSDVSTLFGSSSNIIPLVSKPDDANVGRLVDAIIVQFVRFKLRIISFYKPLSIESYLPKSQNK